MSEPLIVGIRHHSPACARLVKSLIESQRPRYVLIEGPADFNDRVDELFLAHQLPVAIYSYCQYQDGAAPGRGAWTPFAEFSPEWQALQACGVVINSGRSSCSLVEPASLVWRGVW